MSAVLETTASRGRIYLRGQEMAECFFQAHDDQLSHAGGWDLVFGDRFGRGVLNLDGERHRRYRKALMPSLTRRAADGYRMVVRDVLCRALPSVPDDEPVDLHALLRAVVFEVSATVFAGIRGPAAMDLLTAYSQLQDPGAPLGTAEGNRVARQVVRARHRMRDALIEAVGRMAGADGPVQRLRALPDAPCDEIVAQHVAILILAGFETTSYVTARLLWLLARHPHCQDAIRDDTTGKRLDSAFTECLRLHPPLAWLPRKAETTMRFGETLIPAGSEVFYAVTDTHRDPDLFEAPGEFRPERHAEPKPGTYALTPFSAGRRLCAGIHVGTMEVKTITSTVLRRFRLSATSGDYIGDVSRNGSTVTPAATLSARFHSPA